MRGQTMIGYEFEKDFLNGLTFRQNARYADVDVNINSYIGNGNVTFRRQTRRCSVIIFH